MNKEEAIEQLYRLSLDWEETGLDTKLNQADINAIGMVISELDIANKKLDKIKEYADDKREEFNEVIRYYLDDNLIGNEDEVNKLRKFRSWFMEILSIIGGE